MNKIKEFISKVGIARFIIGLFLLSLFIAAPAAGISIKSSLENVIARFGMFAILVLSLIPMIEAGCGLNFGIPIGIVAGILGAVISLEFNIGGFAGIFLAMAIDRKSTRLNSSHQIISYAVFCLKK